MVISMKQGVCKYCGQVGMVEAPEIPQDEIDELVTSMCLCDDATIQRSEKDREQRQREAEDKALKSIKRIFDDKPFIRDMLNSVVHRVAGGNVASITVKMADEDLTASLKLKADGGVRVTRKETETKVEE